MNREKNPASFNPLFEKLIRDAGNLNGLIPFTSL